MTHLDALTKQGLRATVQPGGKLRLEPDWLITDSIREFVRGHRDELVEEIASIGNADVDGSSEEIVPGYSILWVATDLDAFEEFDPRYGYELNCEPVYRMLDASYYAWLRHCMENAKASNETGRLDDATFNALRARFNVVHAWAVEHIGENALRRAMRTTNVKTYMPPSDQTFAAYRKTWDDAWEAYCLKIGRAVPSGTNFPSERATSSGDTRCSGADAVPPSGSGSKTVPAEAVARVDAIRDKAMALGWTEEGLYGNSGKHPFPYGDGHGVVRFLKMNREIGEVTAEAIEIVETHHRPDGTVTHTSLRHYNPHVRQPWRTISGQTQAG